ncbi:MAG: hypothetical protein SFV18_08995 [Bryobacteraceae bacterium]|nr:hypothetical protein [Bryobacteraceae bacterium]
MAQLYFYVPDAVAEDLRRKARKEGLSLSKYIAKQVTPATDEKGWPIGYFDFIRANPLSDDFELPDDPPPTPEDDAKLTW